VPKNSFLNSFTSARDKFVQCRLHFCLSYNRSPELLRITVGLPSACGCGLAGDALPKPYSLSGGQDHEKPRQGADGVGHRELFSGTSVSRLHDTCIPTLSDLSCICCSRKSPSRNFEWFTGMEASSFFRNRQTLIVPRQSRGFT
jgi:hypothetical protein